MKELRRLTSEEQKQWQKFGEVKGLYSICPLFAWCEVKPKNQEEGEIYNEVILTQVGENSIVQIPQDVMVGTRDGYVVSIMNKSGVGNDLFFSSDDFDKALDVFNKTVIALEKTNNL